MWKRCGTLLFFLALLLASPLGLCHRVASAEETLTYDFEDPAEYDVSDPDLVEVADGLGRLVATVPVGDGSDGDLTVTTSVDLSVYRSHGRSAPDIVSYPVISLGTSSATINTTPIGLAQGDEVLLISMQGTSTAYGNVGTHEFLTVASMANSTITFRSDVLGVYGVGADNSDLTGQVIVLQRVPNYTTVTVASGGALTAKAWDGMSGGVLVFRASQSLEVQAGGQVDMSRKGYRGGTATQQQGYYSSWAGESLIPSTRYYDNRNNLGGGGVGMGHCGEASGAGGFGTPGDTVTQSSCSGSPAYHGKPGEAYGDAALTDWYMGSGGGGGGRDDTSCEFSNGQEGGGIIAASAPTISVVGQISALGGDAVGGSASTCDDALGGAGAGGMVYLAATSLGLDGTVTARGGDRTYISQSGIYSGRAGYGRIRLDCKSVNGYDSDTNEALDIITGATVPTPGSINDLAVFTDETVYIETLETLRPQKFLRWSGFEIEVGPNNQGTLLFQLSDDDGITWYFWSGSDWQETEDLAGSEASSASDVDAHLENFPGTTLEVRVFLISNASQAVEIDAIYAYYLIDPAQVDHDGDGFAAAYGDCNDNDAGIFPGSPEDPYNTGYGDGRDNDCDGLVDEGTLRFDDDGDGYAETQGDCDDTDPSVAPGAPEICDGLDNNCNGKIDDKPSSGNTYYADDDRDGYGDPTTTTSACTAPLGYVDNATDCDDAQADIHPGATEICDNRDNNCNGQTDEGVKTTWYLDRDADGYGDSAASTASCAKPSPYYVSRGGDCDDLEDAVHPGVKEVCDDIDQNCDGQADEGLPTYTYCGDEDSDGHGDPEKAFESCSTTAPKGSSTLCDDCAENDATRHPDAPELCDGIDQDCDGVVDNDLEEVTYYEDADGDGHGDPDKTLSTCESAPQGMVSSGDDCDDLENSRYPGAEEIPYDGIDQDCDGHDITDVDGDGYGSLVVGGQDCNDEDEDIHPGAVEMPYDGVDQDCDGGDLNDVDEDGYVATEAGGDDCDDGNPAIHPGAEELPDNIDNNCSGESDEGTDPGGRDQDHDGFTPNGGDCDDTNPEINPLAEEVCGNGIDEDCDGDDLTCATPTPEPGATPYPTPTPGPDATPYPTPTPEPGATPYPTPTPEPGATPYPTPTPGPGATPYPTATPEPGATPYPTPTPEPGATPYPTPTPGPDATPYPTATPEPGATPYPAPTPGPGATPYPTETPGPGDTPYPTPTTAPEETPYPTPTEVPADGDDDVSPSSTPDSDLPGGEGCNCSIQNDSSSPSGRFALLSAGVLILLRRRRKME